VVMSGSGAYTLPGNQSAIDMRIGLIM
jgi:hypothetical protein